MSFCETLSVGSISSIINDLGKNVLNSIEKKSLNPSLILITKNKTEKLFRKV